MKIVFRICAFLLALLPVAAGGQFTAWSTPMKMASPPNSPYLDTCVSISKSGLSLFFSSSRLNVGNPANRELFVSQRDSVDSPWNNPEPLEMLNSSVWDSCPALSLDEHRLYFTSTRAGGCGGHDLWVSRRHDRRDDLGWESPVNLGCAFDGYVNTPFGELTPTFFEAETGQVVMYFSSNRNGYYHLYQSVMGDDDTFGPATPVVELNSSGTFIDQGVTVRRDGLEVIFGSTRQANGRIEFWTATRASTEDPWSTPVHVPSLGTMSGRIALSFDGRELYFGSAGTASPSNPDNFDLWIATRERLREKK